MKMLRSTVHIPMSCEEIAGFLTITPKQVAILWRSDALKRTIFHEERLTSALARSSIYDVIECALGHGHLPVTMNRADAALWVECLSELSEWESWHTWNFAERSAQLLAEACAEGLCQPNDEAGAKAALAVVLTQSTLQSICSDNDMKEAVSDCA